MTAPRPSPAGLSPLLDQLDEAREKATPGEWHVASSGAIDAGKYDTVIGRGDVDCMAHCYGGTSTIDGDNLAADAALIVAVVNALPDLIAKAREMDARIRAGLALADELTSMAKSTRTSSLPHTRPGATERARLYDDLAAQLRAALTAALTPGADTAGATA